MLTSLDAEALAEVFPTSLRTQAIEAATAVLPQLEERQWTERSRLTVQSETIEIPARLRFANTQFDRKITGDVLSMIWCLETRSNDGFQRQRAVHALLSDVRSWSAPFIVALIGEYVIEILGEIQAGLSPAASSTLAAFISENPQYWQRTRQRVASYWDVYYRGDFRRAEYVGFQLVADLDAAVRGRSGSAAVNG